MQKIPKRSKAPQAGISPSEAFRDACELVGGRLQMAVILGVTEMAVHQWMTGNRPLPAKRCPMVERATNGLVRCESLNPEIDWAVVRGSKPLESVA